MCEQYFKGVFAAYLGANFMNVAVPEWKIDAVKEKISRFSEAMIEHSQLSYKEKEEKRRQMKQSLEAYIHGVKDELRREWRTGWRGLC